LSTSFKSLKANLALSSAVALTGIGLPIALSFSLQSLLDATPLQAFAAGAALCSTSLGTTFTVLASSGLANSRLGVVLTSAAMMDDVVGLVMVQVISNLGRGSISAVTVVRPVLVSLAFALVAPLTCRLIVKPVTLSLNSYRVAHPASKLAWLLKLQQTAFAMHTLLLIALVAAASYAGTSNLFAAYIAGAAISWWDSEVAHDAAQVESAEAGTPTEANVTQATAAHLHRIGTTSDTSRSPVEEKPRPQASMQCNADGTTSGIAVYEHYYEQVVSRLLQPFFFASIGFSIPITRMFSGYIVWRGVIYSLLMTLGKLICGLWLVRLPVLPARDALRKQLTKVKLPPVPHRWGKGDMPDRVPGNAQPEQVSTTQEAPSADSPIPPKPLSLYPPLMLALAMTARGEIGFLISAVAESKGVFASTAKGNSGGESDIFLVVTWAIVLCTIIGPLGVGLCVRRVKTLEQAKNREHRGGGKDVLGVWGIE
jgi:Kef-type K+ transport system membrane component KefB